MTKATDRAREAELETTFECDCGLTIEGLERVFRLGAGATFTLTCPHCYKTVMITRVKDGIDKAVLPPISFLPGNERTQ